MKGLKWLKREFVDRKAKVAGAIGGVLILVSPAWCDISGDSALKNFLKTLFNVLTFAGVVLIIAGAASLIRTIVSIASGEQAQPGAIGRGLGLLIGGIVLAALKAVITAVIGQDPTGINFLT